MLETLLKEIIPVDDKQRLAALHKFDILYTPAEEAFDRITQMMAEVFGTPMAFISLVDEDKVFYKSQVGPFGRDKVNRVDSLCSLTILNKEPLVIEDASGEACFADNPFVNVKDGIRFYAGAPLVTKEGQHIGAACVIDNKQRTFSGADKRLLVRFAEMVMHEIEVRHVSFRQIEIQEELNKAQTQLHTALEVGQITPWHWDAISNKVYGDAGLAKMFGMDLQKAREGLAIEVYISSIHPDDQQSVRDAISRSFDTGNDYEDEFRVYNVDGDLRWVISRGRPRFENGLPASLSGSLIDITEKRKAAEEIAQKNYALNNLYRELQFVIDTIPQLAWIRDEKGDPVYLNQGWMAYTGLASDVLMDNANALVLHPDDLEKVASEWKRAIATGEWYQVEYRLKRFDGMYRWFLGRGTPMKDTDGRISKWYGTSTDIHGQKMAAMLLESQVEQRTKELSEANKTLTQINAELEQFTYISHHDLQEPIRKILIFTDLIKMEDREKLSEASQKRLDKVVDAAKRMSVALRDVLDFASLTSVAQETEVSLANVVDEVVLDLELVIAEKDATITIQELPVITAAPHQMHQLFYNLINNALKFSKAGVKPEITIKSRILSPDEIEKHPELDREQTFYEISITDNGIGFDQGASERIFGLFQRLHNKHEFAGTGIGLALCKKVVMNHRGKISACGVPGKGASFTVLLPATI